MTDLREGEFDLDGYRFGTADNDAIILADGLDTGSPGIRANDFDNPVGDGGGFGRDYLNGPTWNFTLGVVDDEDVYTTLADIAAVWRNEEIRHRPGAVSVLRFKRAGRTYRVYGRPRRFGVSPAEIADTEWQIVATDFQVGDPFMFADAEETVTLSLARTTEPGEGLVLPATLPATLSRSSNKDNGVVTVRSIEPVPFRLRIDGPVTGAITDMHVTGPGFEYRLKGSLRYDESLVIDTRQETIRKNGVPVPGMLLPPSRLNARMRTGTNPVTFSADDPTRTATFALSWRPTYPIL